MGVMIRSWRAQSDALLIVEDRPWLLGILMIVTRRW